MDQNKNERNTGIIYRNKTDIINKLHEEKLITDIEAVNIYKAYTLMAYGEMELAKQIIADVPSFVQIAFFQDLLSLIKINMEKYQKSVEYGKTGGRPVNYANTIFEFFKKKDMVISEAKMQKLNEWFVYLHNKKVRTNKKSVHEILDGVLEHGENIVDIIDANIKSNNLSLDFDILGNKLEFDTLELDEELDELEVCHN